jgi:hypothetical protein
MAKIKDLIAKAGGSAEDAVASAKTHYVDQIRAILRDITRLKFTDRQGVESQHTSVPIRVMPGLPEPLKQIGEQELPTGELLGIETIGLWAHDIKSLRGVSERLKPLVVALAQTDAWRQRAEQYSTKVNQAVGLADELASYAAQAKLLKRITEINEDILGVYMPIARLIPDRGQIEVYWVVIGAVARLLGVDAEALAVVVIAHELAHAYTHVGLDSNSNRWEEGFWGCDRGILEGLAQFYTHMTVLALKDERGYERVWTAYDQLTKLQGANGADLYVNHLNWLDTISPETMRLVLLDLRRGHIERDFDSFCEAMTNFANRYPLKPKRTHA